MTSGGGELHMDPAPIDKSGADLQQTAADAQGKAAHALDASTAAAGAHHGWATAAATTAARDAWTARLHKTVDEIADAGRKLQSSAQSVTAADQEGARRLEAAGKELDR